MSSGIPWIGIQAWWLRGMAGALVGGALWVALPYVYAGRQTPRAAIRSESPPTAAQIAEEVAKITKGSLVPDVGHHNVWNSRLPGISTFLEISVSNVTELRRKVFFEYKDPEGSGAKFYLSASDIFTFSITDMRGEAVLIEVPMGDDGISMGKFNFLVLSAGTASNYSFIGVFVNGRKVAERVLEFPLWLGSRRWGGRLGGSLSGESGGDFSFFGTAIWSTSLTEEEIVALSTGGSVDSISPRGQIALPPPTPAPPAPPERN